MLGVVRLQPQLSKVRFSGPAWACVLVCAACGGTSERVGRSQGVPDGHSTIEPDAATTAISDEPPRAAPEAELDETDDPELFDDPGCPQAPEPIEERTCDPFAETSSCPFDWDCFPYVDYPIDPCASEVYGTRCEPSGTGVQGDPCETAPCAAGYLCVASGQGTVCARLCELPAGANSCPAGLICGSVDIKGYGVCF